MTIFSSQVDTRSDIFKRNAEAMRGLVDDLRRRTEQVRLGGGEEPRKRHVARGKLLPRERVRALLDPGAARPPRQSQWSIGVQREITKDLVIEAEYVGNRGVWWPGPLGYLNQVSPQAAQSYGLQPYTNPTDNLLLGSTLSSAGFTGMMR